jgi:phage terminase large subunit
VLVEDHARRINALTERDPPPRAIVCDHDREGRATLEKYLGRGTIPAIKAIEPGIQLVAARLRPAKSDGKPRLFIMRDATLGRDRALDERKAPCSTADEFPGYCWPEVGKGAGRLKGEIPVGKDDHGLDCCRYMVSHLDRAAPDWKLRVY